MKKTLMILALPFLAATAFAQSAGSPAGQAAGSVTQPMPASGQTRADVKADIKDAPKGVARNNDVQSVTPAATTKNSGTTRADVKAETKAAGAAGELKTNGALDSVKVAPSGNATTSSSDAKAARAEAKAEKKRMKKMKKQNMQKKAVAKTGDEPGGK